MVNIDMQSRTPIYEQIVEQIEKYIAYGILKPEEQIESIRDLASRIGINPNTVKKAYDELENRGVITVISTKGTYVTKNIDNVKQKIYGEKISIIKEAVKELEKLGFSKGEVLKEV